MMRFGAPLPKYASVEEWVKLNKKLGYNAAYVPVDFNASESEKDEYIAAAKENDIVIAEVGAWSNIIAPDKKERDEAVELNIQRLAHADRMGARCCVNTSGSKGTVWCGPAAGNYTKATYDEIVSTIQHIIDTAKPEKSFYTMELMQWAYPDTVDSYLDLIRDIDRDAFAVHLDPVNMINSPDKYYGNAAIIKDSFARLGSKLRSCHAKDVIMTGEFLVHISEIRIGSGLLDYETFLTEMQAYPEVPLMLEHLDTQEDYRIAAENVRKVAAKLGFAMPQPE